MRKRTKGLAMLAGNTKTVSGGSSRVVVVADVVVVLLVVSVVIVVVAVCVSDAVAVFVVAVVVIVVVVVDVDVLLVMFLFMQYNNHYVLGKICVILDEGFFRRGLPPNLGGNLGRAVLRTLALPYPIYPALGRQDTTYSWDTLDYRRNLVDRNKNKTTPRCI